MGALILTIYYYSTGGFVDVGWRQVGAPATEHSDLPIILTDSFYLNSKSDQDREFTFTGAVKVVDTSIIVDREHTFISSVYPLGHTLESSGIRNYIIGGASPAVSDQILTRTPDGGFDYYFYSTGPFFGVGWRQDAEGSVDYSNFELPSGFVLSRVNEEDFNIKLPVPSSWFSND